MKKVKITLMKIVNHQDLIEKYENPILHTCNLKVGDEYVLTTEEVNGNSERASISYKGLPSDLEVGSKVLISLLIKYFKNTLSAIRW